MIINIIFYTSKSAQELLSTPERRFYPQMFKAVFLCAIIIRYLQTALLCHAESFALILPLLPKIIHVNRFDYMNDVDDIIIVASMIK